MEGKMKRAFTLIILVSIGTSYSTLCADAQPEWITILVHGAVGLGANLSGRTISLIKHDEIEGSSYERNVRKIRHHPYLFSLQPINQLGLHPVTKDDVSVNAAYIFSVLYTDVANQVGTRENNTFYTYGWSGLISARERTCAARNFYKDIRDLIDAKTKEGKKPKIRLIGYSHGCTMVLQFAELRATPEFCKDTFMIDESIFIGLPVNKTVRKFICCDPFKKIYHIYSMSDKIQKLDVFTGPHILSDRDFKRHDCKDLTQIELRFTAALHCPPGKVLPSNMRGIINQSPGHVELWSFGWTGSMYRKNLSMYPVCGAVFIPFLIHAAHEAHNDHVKVDIRPEQERAFVTTKLGCKRICIPFMSCSEYQAFLDKAMSFHPCNPKYRDAFLKLESSVEIKNYK